MDDHQHHELADLLALAADAGVDTSFWAGDPARVPVDSLRRVLAALGVAAGGPDEVLASRESLALAPWRRTLPPVIVTREGRVAEVAAHVPAGGRAEGAVEAWIVTEDGARHDLRRAAGEDETREVDGEQIARARFPVPAHLPLGWHTLHARGGGSEAECALVVTPGRLATTAALEATSAAGAPTQRWGLMAQLYSVRSRRSWGIGDFADLADLAAVAAGHGADYVLVNPLHAAEPRPPLEPSPYLPSTRRFFHPLYLRVEDVPEYGYLPSGERTRIEALAAAQHPLNLDTTLLDRDSSFAAKLSSLEAVYAVPRSPARAQRLAAYRAAQGQGLEDFALWCAMAEIHAPDAPEWAYGPRTAFAEAERRRLAARVDFHIWLQWLCDEQLEAAQRSATDAGMSIGIVHDLAVGVQAGGSDAWTLSEVLATGVTVGAPPDMFNQQGQNWLQPPWHPGRLAEAGYAPYRDMLRGILRHAGGIRVDHVLGLFRLWWVPQGVSPQQGAYVRYDHEALVGILALEAQRAGAIVVGEDLGVFEPWVRDYLGERGILGTSILWFERSDGVPIPTEQYRVRCLTSVNTHDLPPTAGFLAGDHVTLRESLGLLARPVEEERAADAAERDAVLKLVREHGLLPSTHPPSVQESVEALYAYTAMSPSLLLGVALVDAVGERRTQNQPGTLTEYPNWQIPLAGPSGEPVLIDDLAGDPRFVSLVDALRRGRG